MENVLERARETLSNAGRHISNIQSEYKHYYTSVLDSYWTSFID